MIRVTSASGRALYLLPLDGYTTAQDAAMTLWGDLHKATKVHGGKAILRTPDEGEFGFSVHWESGPKGWATEFVTSDESCAPGFTAEMDDEDTTVRFTDLD